MQGTVYIRFQIDLDGMVKSAALERSSGWRLLDEAVLDIINRWRFEPARRSRIPVESELIVPFEFSLRR
jgi:protein TonB